MSTNPGGRTPVYADRPASQREKPRRVRNGVRLAFGALPLRDLHWAGDAWMRAAEGLIDGAVLREGFEYARLGQTRGLEVKPGEVRATVQGTRAKPYTAVIRVATLGEADWARVVEVLSDQAVHSARLLAGELPDQIEEVLSPCGVRLLPTAGDLSASCTCGDERSWCKHAACAALLIAEAFGRDPFLVFTLRGLAGDELMGRLRRARTSGISRDGQPPRQGIPAALHGDPPELEASLESFWEAGEAMWGLDTSPRAPEVSHPLLRRLGPSPFADARFPLSGLLATCYDTISERALRDDEEPGVEGGDEGGVGGSS